MTYEISVIIPVYNVETYIRQCLNSIVEQTLGIENIEVIVVNDCTPDNSMAIVEEFASKYPSFKVINHKTNKGLGEARNTGLKYVTSNYVTFVDSDDFIKQNTYENSINKLKQTTSDLLIYNWEFFTENYVEPPSIHKPCFDTDEIIDDFKNKPELVFYTSAWNKIYEKSLFKYLKYPSGLYEDNEISCEVLINASKIYLNSEGCYFYRKNPQSITESISIENSLELCNSIKKLNDICDEYPDYRSLINQLIIKFIHDGLFWIYYYDWNLDNEIAMVSKLQEVSPLISRGELQVYKSVIYSHFPYYEEDVLNLSKYNPKDFLAIYKYFKSNLKVSAVANLYVDTGTGFSEENKIAVSYTPAEINKLSFDLKNYENIVSLRFDPVEGGFSKVKIFTELAIKSSNSESKLDDGYDLFTTLDPNYILEYNSDDTLEIEFNIKFLSKTDLANLINEKNNIINNLKTNSKKGLFSFRNR